MKIIHPVRLSLLLILSGLAGCGGKTALPDESSPPEDIQAVDAAASEPAPTATPGSGRESDTWVLVWKTDPLAFPATVVGFFDESLGYTAGYAGEVHYTTDGGKTWPAAENASMCRFGMDILDAKIAWTIGNGGNVRMTKDAGRTWTPLADVPIGLSQFISMADETTGWAANSIRLVATADGGRTWTAVDLPKGVQGIVALSLRTPEEGYLVDKSGTLFITRDGGQTWTGKGLGLENTLIAPKQLPMGAVRFADPDHGVLVVSPTDRGAVLVVLRTADGGDTWTVEELPEKAGVLFLTRDASLLTVFSMNNRIALLRYQGESGR